MLPPRKRRLSLSQPTVPEGKRTPMAMADITEEELVSALHLLSTHNDHGVRSIGVILEAILAIIMGEGEADGEGTGDLPDTDMVSAHVVHDSDSE